MTAICHIRLSKIKILNFPSGAGNHMHHRAKFNQNRSKGCRHGDLMVFIMAAVCRLGFLAVKRPMLHHRTKFRKDGYNVATISRFL